MWETTFDPSMIGKSSIIVHCPDKFLANKLMEILEYYGVKWATGVSPKERTFWDDFCENTCYWISIWKTLTYGDKEHAKMRADILMCTFYGEQTEDYPEISEDELNMLLGIVVNKNIV